MFTKVVGLDSCEDRGAGGLEWWEIRTHSDCVSFWLRVREEGIDEEGGVADVGLDGWKAEGMGGVDSSRGSVC